MLENSKVLNGWRVTIPKSFREVVDFIRAADFPVPCDVRFNANLRALEVIPRETKAEASPPAEFDFETGVAPSRIALYPPKNQMRLSLPSVLGGTLLLPDIGKPVLLRARNELIEVWTPENYVDWLKNNQEDEER